MQSHLKFTIGIKENYLRLKEIKFGYEANMKLASFIEERARVLVALRYIPLPVISISKNKQLLI
ncbi:hypothetical protein AS132_17790 [Photobacterium sanguinicancri]|uniref:Uncharacterized protein n=1 Tax=Photobacterium sanguinicancri TaxID=875932 RepID=A0ABX4FY72_9GAMM|nr:hypothetical protein AS132_17790 [Photobacterium sanguinicancri]OZS43627.1 hypothetical protein ASV53_12200 [Photobacterium sanguinicancri]